jgi:hypothetical protein
MTATGLQTTSTSLPPGKRAAKRDGVRTPHKKSMKEKVKEKYIHAPLRVRQQNPDSCTFSVIVDGVTIYSIDLSTVTVNTTISFNTSNFTPQANSSTIFQEVCPPDVPFPVLNIANLFLVTGPAPPGSAVSSSTTSVSV